MLTKQRDCFNICLPVKRPSSLNLLSTDDLNEISKKENHLLYSEELDNLADWNGEFCMERAMIY